MCSVSVLLVSTSGPRCDIRSSKGPAARSYIRNEIEAKSCWAFWIAQGKVETRQWLSNATSVSCFVFLSAGGEEQQQAKAFRRVLGFSFLSLRPHPPPLHFYSNDGEKLVFFQRCNLISTSFMKLKSLIWPKVKPHTAYVVHLYTLLQICCKTEVLRTIKLALLPQ